MEVTTRRSPWLGLLVVSSLLVGPARADVVLHEYVAPDPSDDLRLGATTSDGEMAAAIQTQSGPVSSPNPEQPPDPRSTVYGPERAQGGTSSFHVDRDTSKPSTVSYDDPFTPSIAPYKREFAYDGVDDELALVVRDPGQTRVAPGGVARPEDDQFYADIPVDLVEGESVRIPTAGPSARLLAVRAMPPASVQILRDGADNWFVRGDRTARIRLVLHLAVDRAVFGSPFADIEWTRLWRFLPPVSDRAKSDGVRMAREIGVVDGTGPAEALRILVKYFRSFEASNDRPKSSGRELYRELTLSRKGVCRHRSYAFVVTALALGIPSRFVRNEAHAWVEVFDGTRWHRIDLGGAADHLDTPDTSRIAHVPPRDPYEWPKGAESGQAMADRSRSVANGHAAEAAPSPSSKAPDPVPATEPQTPIDDRRGHSSVALAVDGAEARRGARLKISGRVDGNGAPCGEVRVDLFLDPKSGARDGRIPLGTLVTSAEGAYDGRVVVPYGVPPGDYDVRATTPGNQICGEGASP